MRNHGIHHLLRVAKISQDDLSMWVDHFLLSTQITALNAKKLGSITHIDMSALVSIKQQALEASIRRKQSKIKKKEEEELKKEAEVFKLFM